MSDDTKKGDERKTEERDTEPTADPRGEERIAGAEPEGVATEQGPEEQDEVSASPSADGDDEPARTSASVNDADADDADDDGADDDDADDNDADDDAASRDSEDDAHPQPQPTESADLHTASHADPHHEMGHVVPLQTLAAIFGALVVLTILTVTVTSIDLGSAGNLVVAMVIATIKAGLVIAVFMHLLFDRSINLLLFLTGVLFVILFISLAMIDRTEYQPAIDQLETAREAAANNG